MKIAPLVVRTLLLVALFHAGISPADAGQIRCSGDDCETLRIGCRGAGPCVVSIATEGNRSGPYFVSVGPDVFTVTELLTIERLTNVMITTGPADDGVGFIDVSIPGTLRIDTGPGNDRVGWEDTGAAKTWIRTGGGNDEIFLDGGGLGLRSSIAMGAGDDFLHVSSGFRGPSTIDGGGGDDVATVFLIPFNEPPPLRIRRLETLTD